MKAWTDYPIAMLGDAPGVEAPIRECQVLSYDGNKYCRVQVEGFLLFPIEIKAGYLYQAPGRCGEVPPVSQQDLLRLSEASGGLPHEQDDYLIVRKSLLAELIDEAQASVDTYHQGMAGYRPERHATLDALMVAARVALQGEPLPWADDIEYLQNEMACMAAELDKHKACPHCRAHDMMLQAQMSPPQ